MMIPALFSLCLAASGDSTSTTAPIAAGSVYDFTVKDIEGRDVKLDKFKGEVLLIVNVASQCGYTKQYAGMEAVYKKFKDKGFKILGFPANNFGAQEPGTESEIKKFCESKFGVTFPMFAKISVKGDDKAPVYKLLTSHPDAKIGGELKWNFEKYLIGRDGTIVARFGSKTEPEDPKLIEAIEKALAAK